MRLEKQYANEGVDSVTWEMNEIATVRITMYGEFVFLPSYREYSILCFGAESEAGIENHGGRATISIDQPSSPYTATEAYQSTESMVLSYSVFAGRKGNITIILFRLGAISRTTSRSDQNLL